MKLPHQIIFYNAHYLINLILFSLSLFNDISLLKHKGFPITCKWSIVENRIFLSDLSPLTLSSLKRDKEVKRTFTFLINGSGYRFPVNRNRIKW